MVNNNSYTIQGLVLIKPDLQLDHFISRLYESTQDIDIGHFRSWALNELRGLIQFDSCLWSTGHLSTRTFHTHCSIGLPENFEQELIRHLPINPISKQLFAHPGEPVDMREVVSDEEFYASAIYQIVFKPNHIERILSSIHIDSRSGIYTLLSLYRSQKEDQFTLEEKQTHKRALHHLIRAASLAGFASLQETRNSNISYHAICDQHGIYHAVEEAFLDVLEEVYPEHNQQILPFDIQQRDIHSAQNKLVVTINPLGDLYRVSIRMSSPTDQLTEREREVVEGVTNGLSFKQIAKQLGLSPSTISNHLYRVYQKLNINNRAELADLINAKNNPQTS